MRTSLIACALAFVLVAATAQARNTTRSPYPVISGTQYGSAKTAAAKGGAYNITKRFAGRGLLGEFGKFGSRAVQVAPARSNRWKITTVKLNPDNGQPLASTSLGVVRTNSGKFHFVNDGQVRLNLPIVMTHTSLSSAARAAAAKTMLKDADVKHWFAERYGLKGADVISELRIHVERQTAKTADVRVYHRSNGQDGEPFLSTTIKVRQLKSGQWRGYAGPASSVNVNGIWE